MGASRIVMLVCLCFASALSARERGEDLQRLHPDPRREVQAEPRERGDFRAQRRERLRDMREQLRREREQQLSQRGSEEVQRAGMRPEPEPLSLRDGEGGRLRRLSPEERRELRRQLHDSHRGYREP